MERIYSVANTWANSPDQQYVVLMASMAKLLLDTHNIQCKVQLALGKILEDRYQTKHLVSSGFIHVHLKARCFHNPSKRLAMHRQGSRRQNKYCEQGTIREKKHYSRPSRAKAIIDRHKT